VLLHHDHWNVVEGEHTMSDSHFRLTRYLGNLAWYVVVTTGALLVIGPFIWMFSSSLKANGQVAAFPPQLIPSHPLWSNYREVWQDMPLLRYSLNSMLIAGLSVIGQLFCCSTAAYAFARIPFPGRGALFWALMAALMVPTQTTLIPTFLLMRSLGWLDTYLPIVLPWFLAGAVGTFLLRQFFLTLPMELEDAARIDGCGRWRIFWQIFLPLSGPGLATVAIFTFVSQWNNLVGPLIYLTNQSLWPLTMGLAGFQSEYSTRWNVLMAGTLISVIPGFLIFLFAQRYFIQGIVLGSVKG
jgi:multiple sugar transport system permease protein